VFAVPHEDGALLSFQGWLTPAGIWSLDAAGHLADTGITPKPNIDVSGMKPNASSPPRRTASRFRTR